MGTKPDAVPAFIAHTLMKDTNKQENSTVWAQGHGSRTAFTHLDGTL